MEEDISYESEESESGERGSDDISSQESSTEANEQEANSEDQNHKENPSSLLSPGTKARVGGVGDSDQLASAPPETEEGIREKEEFVSQILRQATIKRK
jgi:hypothetical protein